MVEPHTLLSNLMVLWLCVGMTGTITLKYQHGITNMLTILAIVFGPVWLVVVLLLPAKLTRHKLRLEPREPGAGGEPPGDGAC